MSLPGPVLAAYAISLYGAGDHVADRLSIRA